MKTQEFAALLAVGAGPVASHAVEKRLAIGALIALAVAVAASLAILGPVPARMLAEPAMWIKLAYAGGLAVCLGWAADRMARPGAPVSQPALAALLVVTAMAAAGLAGWLSTTGPAQQAYLLGKTALRCPWVILALSLPGLGALLAALRVFGPVRPRLAGLAAGLLAGALGAAGYALYCTETSIGFVAIWYSLGIALAGLVGAALGPRLLAW